MGEARGRRAGSGAACRISYHLAMPVLESFKLATHVVGFNSIGEASVVETGHGPPPEINGLSVGVADMAESPPHGGEVHPDGDELVCVLEGTVRVHVEHPIDDSVMVCSGEAIVIPRNVWHRVEIIEPSRLLTATPGPNSSHRPLSA